MEIFYLFQGIFEGSTANANAIVLLRCSDCSFLARFNGFFVIVLIKFLPQNSKYFDSKWFIVSTGGIKVIQVEFGGLSDDLLVLRSFWQDLIFEEVVHLVNGSIDVLEIFFIGLIFNYVFFLALCQFLRHIFLNIDGLRILSDGFPDPTSYGTNSKKLDDSIRGLVYAIDWLLDWLFMKINLLRHIFTAFNRWHLNYFAWFLRSH